MLDVAPFSLVAVYKFTDVSVWLVVCITRATVLLIPPWEPEISQKFGIRYCRIIGLLCTQWNFFYSFNSTLKSINVILSSQMPRNLCCTVVYKRMSVSCCTQSVTLSTSFIKNRVILITLKWTRPFSCYMICSSNRPFLIKSPDLLIVIQTFPKVKRYCIWVMSVVRRKWSLNVNFANGNRCVCLCSGCDTPARCDWTWDYGPVINESSVHEALQALPWYDYP
jgi:hypothetical protein